MAKPVFVEDDVESYVQKFVENKTPVVGVIIGFATDDCDYVIRLVRCVTKQGLEQTVDNFSFDGEWLGGMAVELSRMIPGGFTIIGVFAVTLPIEEISQRLHMDVYQAYHVFLKGRQASLARYNLFSSDHHPWIVVHFDLTTGICLTCNHADVSKLDPSEEWLSAADWRYASNSTNWGFFHAYFHIDEVTIDKSINVDVYDQLLAYIDEQCQKIATATVLFNDKVLNEDLKIEDLGNIKTLPEKVSKVATCKAYVYCPDDRIEIKEVNYADENYSAHVLGSIFACCYLPVDRTVKDVIDEMKRDAIANFQYRCLLIAEYLEDEDEELTENTVLHFPRRWAFRTNLSSEHFMFFDLVLISEDMEVVIERIEEAFDVVVTPSMVTSDLEFQPDVIVDKFKIDVIEDLGEVETTLGEDKADQSQVAANRKLSLGAAHKPSSLGKSKLVRDVVLKSPTLSNNVILGTIVFAFIAISFAVFAIVSDILLPSAEGPSWISSFFLNFDVSSLSGFNIPIGEYNPFSYFLDLLSIFSWDNFASYFSWDD